MHFGCSSSPCGTSEQKAISNTDRVLGAISTNAPLPSENSRGTFIALELAVAQAAKIHDEELHRLEKKIENLERMLTERDGAQSASVRKVFEPFFQLKLDDAKHNSEEEEQDENEEEEVQSPLFPVSEADTIPPRSLATGAARMTQIDADRQYGSWCATSSKEIPVTLGKAGGAETTISEASRRLSDFSNLDGGNSMKSMKSEKAKANMKQALRKAYRKKTPARQSTFFTEVKATVAPGELVRQLARSPHRTTVLRSNSQEELRFQLLGYISRAVDTYFFEYLVTAIIIFSSVTTALDVQWSTRNTGTNSIYRGMEDFCRLFFLCELAVRICAYRWAFFTNTHRYWSLFDLFMVLVSLIEFLDFPSFNAAALKMLRMARVIRVFRFIRPLWRLTQMILNSMKVLFWALVLLGIEIVSFAVCITMSASEWLKSKVDTDQNDWYEQLQNHTSDNIGAVFAGFGSVNNAAYSLSQAVLGNPNWDTYGQMFEVDQTAKALVWIFLFFTLFAVLNIITAVFVDEAMSRSMKGQDLIVEEEMKEKDTYLTQLQEFFDAMDADGDGSITLEDLSEILRDDSISAYFSVLGLEVSDARRLFYLLDRDRSGEVQAKEFLEGCCKLKGTARSIDVHEILVATDRMHRNILKMTKLLETSLNQKQCSDWEQKDSYQLLSDFPRRVFRGSEYSLHNPPLPDMADA